MSKLLAPAMYAQKNSCFDFFPPLTKPRFRIQTRNQQHQIDHENKLLAEFFFFIALCKGLTQTLIAL